MKTFVIGDIHGRLEALEQCLERSKFDYDNDKLIILGDIVDGGYFTYQVVEELLKIKHKSYIIGNHDFWWMNHLKSGWAEEIWIQQGGANTLRSYGGKVIEADYVSNSSIINTKDLRIPVTHQDFFNRGVYYHIENNMIFVHGGFDPNIPIEKNTTHRLTWDRDLIKLAMKNPIPKYDKVFVGHTTTQSIKRDEHWLICLKCNYEKNKYLNKCPKCNSKKFYHSKGHNFPLKFNNLYCLDCGAGWNGRLVIQDINTDEYWYSSLQTPAINNNEN